MRRQRIWIARSTSSSRPISGSSTPLAAISVRSRENSDRKGVSFFLSLRFFSLSRYSRSSRAVDRRMPFSTRMREASDFFSRSSPSRMCSVPMYLWSIFSASSAAYASTRLDSTDSGISTEVEIFSRTSVRAWISLRIASGSMSARASSLPVRPLFSRIRPSSRCSVSMVREPS